MSSPKTPIYTVTVTAATVYRVRGDNYEWAEAAVREWPKGGSISIQSSFGNFANTWTAIGSDTFTEFLRSLDFDYFMRKARPDDYEEFDLALTLAEIRKYLLGARRQAYLSKANARTCWDEIAEMADWGEQEWHHRVQHTETLGLLFCNDPSSIPTRRRKNIQCQRFWEEIWPALCEAWKSHEAVAA